LRAQQAQTTGEQIQTKTREQDYTQNLDFLNRDGLLQCQNCQAKLAPGQKFCSGCGIPATAQTQPRHCTSCGEALKLGQKLCPGCGTKAG
jgi:peptide methionine sulfoxide reductase MsrB